MRRRRGRRSGISSFSAGLIGIVVLVLITYLVFTKFANPFASPYTIHTTFSSASGLRPASLVRIAGVDVGKVQSISPVSTCKVRRPGSAQCTAADVTITIDKQGLPLHTDATFWIRPRTFLEGNFFVDVNPGTPSAPKAPSGYTFPVQQGVEPVQLDQLLTSLQLDTRRNLQILLQQYGKAVKLGGASYNASIPYWLPAYQYTSVVAHDALGSSRTTSRTGLPLRARSPQRSRAHPRTWRTWSPTSTRPRTRSPGRTSRSSAPWRSCR